MIFTLEALKAKKGDSLLLHLGTEDQPILFVIDGGPAGVYRRSLRPRLDAIRDKRAPGGQLEIPLMMVSHIDDDHIKGILDLTDKQRERREERKELEFRVATLWHNSFDDVIGGNAEALFGTASAEVAAAEAGVADGALPSLRHVSQPSSLLLSSVPQGRNLRNNAGLLGIQPNLPFGKLVVAEGNGAQVQPPLAEGLETWVLGPSRKRVAELQEKWDKELERRGLGQPAEVSAAAYLDGSVYNLASIVVLLRAEGREMLLTGDARGDDILAGAREAGLLDADGRRHVALLKLPHHGSDRNVETDFFRAITADHYVVSGDGSHGNPELATFEMLFAARRGDERSFTLHLTYPPEEYRAYHGTEYPVAELRELFQREREKGQRFDVVTPGADELSVKIDLADPYTGP